MKTKIEELLIEASLKYYQCVMDKSTPDIVTQLAFISFVAAAAMVKADKSGADSTEPKVTSPGTTDGSLS